MVMSATPIQRIYNMPGHQHYGSCRRLWVMLEQLFADGRGIEAFEVHMHAFQEGHGRAPIWWDRHLASLIDGGLSAPEAQRLVMQQMLVASEWIA